MAHLNSIEPIRYAQSLADSSIFGLLRTKEGGGFDCSAMNSVDGFDVKGAEPVGTHRCVAFLVDGKWGALTPSGTFRELSEQSISAESVVFEGNTVEDLQALSSVPAFVGKKIGVAVGLSAPSADSALPTFGISLKCKTPDPITTKTILSDTYALDPDSRILKLTAKVLEEDGGRVQVTARVSSGGVLSEWGELASFVGSRAEAVQFRAILTAQNIGISVAGVRSVSMQYRAGNDGISGAGVATLYSVTRDWYVDLRQCRLTVRHAPLKQAQLEAYCAIRDKTNVVKGERIGTGTGEKTTYQLAHTSGVAYDSVRLYADGARIMAGYEFNAEVARITVTAPAGVVLTADYVHGWTEENWRKMTLQGTRKTPNYDSTEWRLILPKSESGRSIASVRVDMKMTEGHIDDEPIGTGTGKMQTCILSHVVKEGAVRVFSDGVELPSADWSLRPDGTSISVIAPPGVALTASYDWISETPVLQQFVAVFAE